MRHKFLPLEKMLQLADLVANYPSSGTTGIQTIISAKKEFRDVASYTKEPPPTIGSLGNNQKFLLRYMIPNDKVLMMWQTGTGKTCGYAALAEYYHDLYDKDPENATIRKAIILANPGLHEEIKLQLACRCTQNKYITEQVTKATREQVRKNNLTRSIGRWYTINTYKRFLIPLEALTDDDIRRMYSHVIFIIDEAHNIAVDLTETGRETMKVRIYRQLWRLLHLAEGCKILLATATPMINEAKEISPLANLLLDADQQLPTEWDYTQVTLQQMEPYLRGKVSFVRALDTGINVVLEGELQDVTFDTPEGQITTQIVVKTSIMEDIQNDGYRASEEQQSGVYDNERQASNFVFPDGTWGGTFPRLAKTPEEATRATEYGLGRYVVSPSADIYRSTPELLKQISDLNNLRVLSAKNATTIEEVIGYVDENGVEHPPALGTVFVYNDFVFGSGAIIQGLCFEANGFQRFRGDQPAFEAVRGQALPALCSGQGEPRRITINPEFRYAVITSETPAAHVSRILDLFNSPENVYGEYLKVLIGSQVAREGLNLSHVTQIHLVTTWWNQSANYQAISRGIRATSHVPLLNEEKKRITAAGGDPSTARIQVYIYKHVAVPANGVIADSVDFYMYQLADKKDYEIRRMERILKQIAIDCWIHYDRNVRPDDEDYTPGCDYAECEYQCFDPRPASDDIDRVTFDVYYIEDTLRRAVIQIVALFSLRFSFHREEIYALLDNFRPVVIDRSLAKIIAEKRIIFDKYGFVSYLREDGDRFFLQRDYPLEQESSQALEIYTSDLIANREISLPIYLSLLDVESQEEIIRNIITLPPTNPRFETLLQQLTDEGRISLLETAVYELVSDPNNPNIASLDRIISFYSNLLYILEEPVADINAIEERQVRKKDGPGRKRKESAEPKLIRLTPEELITDVTELTLDDALARLDNGEGQNIIFLHTLYNMIFDRVSYSVSTRFKKGDGRLRLFKPSEGVGWRDVRANEVPVYSAVVEAIHSNRIAPFEDLEIYGTILHDKKFRINDKTTQRTRAQQGKQRKDARYDKRGRVCKTFDKADLITILWKVNAEAPITRRVIPDDPNELVNLLIRRKIIRNEEEVQDWSDEQLRYYAQWDAYGTRAKICDFIQSHFNQTGRLVVV